MLSIQDLSVAESRGGKIVRVEGEIEALPLTNDDVWLPGGNRTLPVAAAVVSIASGSANDDDGGSGAELVRVTGLDGNLKEISEVVEMDGMNPVVTVQEFLRVFLIEVTQTGTQPGSNEGVIDATVGGDLQARIPIGRGMSAGSHYTIPVNMEGRLVDIEFCWPDPIDAIVQVVRVLPNGTLSIVLEFTAGPGSISPINLLGLPALAAGTDIFVRAEKQAGAADHGLSASYAMYLAPPL